MNRRNFIYSSGMLAALSASSAMGAPLIGRTKPARGIQLYMVKEDMERDPIGTLKQLGAMGYTQIESYGSDKGIFWGKTNTEFKKIAGGYGLNLVSTHYNPCTLEEFDKLAAQGAEIGMKYLICPWLGPQKTINAFKTFADDFNKRGAICKKHGLRFGYHPHDYPYKPVDGQLPIDVLLAGTDKALVDFEMDVYYTVTEGADPYAYMRNHKGRFKLAHLRDVLKKRLPADSKEESACDMGEGIINFKKFITTGQDTGMQYFFVEQSRFYHETPLQSARKNMGYLKGLRLT
ncbi:MULTISPECIES: sugar phosphate isomerase/epimerase [unclassified Mucilaginibacter]|uniref:sugar phosphate isomerase/epimerase family protein n=1 Tax=unclassified Mucilaginibacter TaxID=2617802 RepID=UPI002AC92D83|nr:MULTISPECIES: sugar phosphate isomerase/epimerase [unclassified Mucilaginibacter]MEB0248550.1 sugar phosphate isomerase/epimerase [Mucilaginibacter sp. 5B2]MEB0262595.1 sugar phosphate isomerase/epimerase [Mucilaginibacter sp. 10I4]MEB0279214.1 sugar phosphate isomerase/epimerase [Mucilaginibacter sp. 10B2]MEB0300686.1 sugar phosphate isomerase/epimerase [Mucilaginibacter sp. 5C4]WPX23273.1 sugar phosphate isomerase/epimerase [Mucilaginibacter sp. 5C4]